MIAAALILVCIALPSGGDIRDCDPDPRDAIIYAHQLARALQYFMKNCMGIAQCLKNRTSINALVEFFATGCDVTMECIRSLGTDNITVVSGCSMPLFWANFNRSGVYKDEELSCLKDGVDCGMKGIPNIEVGKLLLSHFRKLVG